MLVITRRIFIHLYPLLGADRKFELSELPESYPAAKLFVFRHSRDSNWASICPHAMPSSLNFNLFLILNNFIVAID